MNIQENVPRQLSSSQLGMLSWMARSRFKDRLPDEWKDDGPKPGADWRLVNFEKWCRDHVGFEQAKEIIGLLSKEQTEEALNKLQAIGLRLSGK